MLQDIKRDVMNGTRPLADAITRALPEFRGKLSEQKVAYLVNEYQGYSNIAHDWYKRPTKEYPQYRIVSGEMKLMKTTDGSVMDVKHPLATNKQFFIAAPISWIEESCGLGIDPTMVEMSEMGKMPMGLIVCVCPRSQIERIREVVKQSLLSFIDEVEHA